MKNRVYAVSLTALAFLTANPAYADENNADWTCSSAKQLVGAASAFHGEQPELTNLIDPQLTVELKGINGHPDPTHLLYRFEGFEYAMPIKDGVVQDLGAAMGWSKKGEICGVYKDGPLGDTEEDALSLSVSFGFPFRRADGEFSVKEIKEGVKDGSNIIKGLAPRGLGFAAPNLQTFVVSVDGETSEIPKLTFFRKGKPTEVAMSRYDRIQYVRMKDIKSANVDSLKIDGPYEAAAFFKIDPKVIAAREASRLAAPKTESDSKN